MLLEIGSRFQVVGWVMLKGIKDGEKFQITSVNTPKFGGPTYSFKRICKNGNLSEKNYCFFQDVIDCSFNALNNNRLEII